MVVKGGLVVVKDGLGWFDGGLGGLVLVKGALVVV